MPSHVEREVESYIRPKNFQELPFHKEVVSVGEMPMVIGSWGKLETAQQYIDYYGITDTKTLGVILGSGFD